jgi:putative N6-adenine-specific DNA methylase
MRISQNHTFIAKTPFGLEDTLAQEIRELGAKDIEILTRAVKFKGNLELLYKANIHLRTALRIIIPIEKFNAGSYDELYENAKKIHWDKYLTPKHSFFIDNNISSKLFTNGHYAALKLKDAIADFFREKYQVRPSIDKESADYRFNLHIYNKQCTISLDSSGESLHKRGYKIKNTQAPLNEVLAAGMILLSGWDKSSPFVDPMCGSGTLPIEAALIAHGIPPGIYREEFGFMRWSNYNDALFEKVIEPYEDLKPSKKIQIKGSDISESAVEVSKNNAENAGLKEVIDFEIKAIENFKPPQNQKGTAIINPPYDVKLKHTHIEDFYKNIGDLLKNNFSGMDVWIFSGNKSAIKKIGLHANKKITLYNGALECKFHYYPIYKGSLKSKKFD